MFAAIAEDRPAGQRNVRPMFFHLICIFVTQCHLCASYRMCSAVLALMHVVVALESQPVSFRVLQQ